MKKLLTAILGLALLMAASFPPSAMASGCFVGVPQACTLGPQRTGLCEFTCHYFDCDGSPLSFYRSHNVAASGPIGANCVNGSTP